MKFLLLLLTLSTAASAENIYCKAGVDISASSLATPARAVALLGSAGNPCVINGDLQLTGTASLTSVSADVIMNGNIKLMDSSKITVYGGSFNLANKSVFEYKIEGFGKSAFSLISSVFKSNSGAVGTSLASYYYGNEQSALTIYNSRINLTTSWLLVNLKGSSKIEAIDSRDLPSEIYPYESSSVKISGPKSGAGIWLDFPAGATAILDDLPAMKEGYPVNFSFGRNTPALTNVKFQIDVVNGYAGIGVASHPKSKVTIRNNQQPMAINYIFDGSTEGAQISGLQSNTTVTKTLTDSGRVLELVNVKLNQYAWQLYTWDNESVPIFITNSTLNELGVAPRGVFKVTNTSLTFATLSSMGGFSFLDIDKSPSIESQSAIAQGSGTIRISNSTIYGTLFQAHDESLILLLNNTFRQNYRNPFSPANANVRFISGSTGGTIIASGITTPPLLKKGVTHGFVGDAFVESKVVPQCTYNLSYRKLWSVSTDTALVSQAPCPKRSWNNDVLGSLNTNLVSAGTYSLKLEIFINGKIVPEATVTKSFFILQ